MVASMKDYFDNSTLNNGLGTVLTLFVFPKKKPIGDEGKFLKMKQFCNTDLAACSYIQ
jgi:hypothetical protein